MKELLLILVGLGCFINGYSQYTIRGELQNTCKDDSVFVLEHDGIALRKIVSIPLNKDGDKANFAVRFPTLQKGFYFVGTNPKNVRTLVLGGTEKEVLMKGSCTNLKTATTNSAIDKVYLDAFAQIQQFEKDFNQQVNQFRAAGGNKAKLDKVIAAMKGIDDKRLKLLHETSGKDVFLGNYVGLHTYLSFHNNKGNYKNEIEYFGNEYLGKINLADPQFQKIPFLFDRVRSYTMTLASVGQPESVQQAFSERLLNTVPKGTKTHKCVLAAIAYGYMQKQVNNSFVKYANDYIKLFGKENPDIAGQLGFQINQVRAFATGGEAPDIVEKTPEGELLSLHSLRGKVVLVDFWASWCRPCRKANPHVVALYNKYKEQGFDVFGVSLDKSKDRWIKAIAADKLTWHHVSDLKGWSSRAAKQYSVRSIPQTLLLDKEGKIIARNLRGAQLDAKLQQIFGF